MNKYETIIIISPNADTETVDKIVADAQNLISGDGSGGKITKLENWGKKRLAYEIRRNKEGFYILIDYELDPKFIQRFERYCILNEQVLKFMTVRAEDIPEPRKKEISKVKFDEDEDFIQPRFTDYDDDEDEDDDDFSYEDDDEDE